MTHSWLLLALVACSDANPNPTKAGTVVLAWQLADSDRVTVRDARRTDVQTRTFEHVDPTYAIATRVVLETATITYEEDGKQVEHRAPVKLTVTAVDAKDFTLANGRCMGPHYDMALPPGRDMILHCIVGAKKPRYDVGFTLYAYGDLRVDDGKPRTIRLYP